MPSFHYRSDRSSMLGFCLFSTRINWNRVVPFLCTIRSVLLV
ncbi:hypothetical protein MUK42_31253 [Musa troglodytarum]|uniref:Uncharacterized protein n=1 Tax=Musa troglodytarum TaxID=320322 RepID=A0A9E7FN06_9LILI|nr:hypothetical protein MUK42_31253 [Musa troglodytarum]